MQPPRGTCSSEESIHKDEGIELDIKRGNKKEMKASCELNNNPSCYECWL